MASISLWVYLKARRTPVQVDNVTAVNLRAAVDTRTGATTRNLFASPVTLQDAAATAADFVGNGVALPHTYDAGSTGKLLIAVSDDQAGRAPQPLATKRDQITLVTDPTMGGADKVFFWRDEVLVLSNCDPNAVPTGVPVWFVQLSGRRTAVPMLNVTAIDGAAVAINQQETYRNTFGGSPVLLLDGVDTKATFINPSNPLPTPYDANASGRLKAVSDEVAGTPPRVLASMADVLSFTTTDAWDGGTTGLWAWRDKVIGVSRRAATS